MTVEGREIRERDGKEKRQQEKKGRKTRKRGERWKEGERDGLETEEKDGTCITRSREVKGAKESGRY